MELLLGCGNSRIKRITPSWGSSEWTKLVTLDIDPNCGADVLCDFSQGLPFADATFDEVHAYDVMEHAGSQGDYRAFFRDFGEVNRVLKPGGLVCGITPHWHGPWLWNDPGHCRSISFETLAFLDQTMYTREVGVTSMTDYRWLWKGDLRIEARDVQNDSCLWILRKYPLPPSPV